MLEQMTLLDTDSAISSPESVDGRLPPLSPDGPRIASYGQARRHASRSRSQESSAAPMTSGTYGPTCFASPVPEGPLSSWESRLRQRLARIGSTECLLTWKASVTPAGRSLSRLVPSTRPTVETDCGLWPTPMAHEARLGFQDRSRGKKGTQESLTTVVVKAMWPTATVGDSRNSRNATASRSSEDSQHHVGWTLSDHAHAMALWPTPVANDDNKSPAAHMAMNARMKARPRNTITSLQVMTKAAPGHAIAGSSATTEKPGALNPDFACWLIGFPPAWASCAPTAMPSPRKSRQK